ncbi:MAG: hypothetical protein LBT95_00785 [Treponema sp.]|nr:hypothetical protein [Treponema sp.]
MAGTRKNTESFAVSAANEKNRSRLEASKLAGISLGEEVQNTGEVHTPIRKPIGNIFSGGKSSGASADRKPGGAWTGPLMLSLFVADQSTAIGRRNIHIVKPGYTFTIGGGKSDFLIFLVPIPSRIAELRFNGEECIIIPRKPQFFPDIGSQPVPDCIGKTIRIISERNYELYIRMERYEDPLITLNRLLRSICVPG